MSPFRHVRHYSEAAAISNISVIVHQVTFDPDASWLKFHLGINRYALYSRDDPAIRRLLKEMQSMTVIGAGERFIFFQIGFCVNTRTLEACSRGAVAPPTGEGQRLQNNANLTKVIRFQNFYSAQNGENIMYNVVTLAT